MAWETVQVTELDVRPMLAAGEEPFDAIISAARQVAVGGVLALTAPFDPVPLYAVLARQGFAHHTEAAADGSFAVRFVQTGVMASATVGEVAARVPAAAPVFARHGMDLCCGGARTLEFVARAHGVELPILLAELQEAAAA